MGISKDYLRGFGEAVLGIISGIGAAGYEQRIYTIKPAYRIRNLADQLDIGLGGGQTFHQGFKFYDHIDYGNLWNAVKGPIEFPLKILRDLFYVATNHHVPAYGSTYHNILGLPPDYRPTVPPIDNLRHDIFLQLYQLGENAAGNPIETTIVFLTAIACPILLIEGGRMGFNYAKTRINDMSGNA